MLWDIGLWRKFQVIHDYKDLGFTPQILLKLLLHHSIYIFRRIMTFSGVTFNIEPVYFSDTSPCKSQIPMFNFSFYETNKRFLTSLLYIFYLVTSPSSLQPYFVVSLKNYRYISLKLSIIRRMQSLLCLKAVFSWCLN